MDMKIAAAALTMAIGLAGGNLPGAKATKVCAAAGAYWPTMTLAVSRNSAWIACKEQSRVIRVSLATGKRTKTIPLASFAIAVKPGFGSVWALDQGGTLYRVNAKTGKVAKRIQLRVSAAYNIWIGGGSLWVADDRAAQVLRVSPRTNRVVAHIDAGDGPASMAFAGDTAWVVNHRDTTINRIELATNRSSRLTTLGGAGDRAPERMVWLDGDLWVTGRGTDLLQVRTSDGAIQRTIEIGGSGIDVVASGGQLWVPTRNAAVDQTGFPTMDSLKRVSVATRGVATVTQPTSRLDVHGLVVANGALWIADNRRGYLYRVPIS